MQLTQNEILMLLTARRDAASYRLIPDLEQFSPAIHDMVADMNKPLKAVIAVLDEMIGAINSIQAELDKGHVVWPVHSLDTHPQLDLVNETQRADHLWTGKEWVDHE